MIEELRRQIESAEANSPFGPPTFTISVVQARLICDELERLRDKEFRAEYKRKQRRGTLLVGSRA